MGTEAGDGSEKVKDVFIKLDEEDFRSLVRGGELKITCADARVRMILSDIGFERMLVAMNDAMSGKDTYKGRQK